MINNNEIKNDNEYLEYSNQMMDQYNELKKETINFKKDEECSSYLSHSYFSVWLQLC